MDGETSSSKAAARTRAHAPSFFTHVRHAVPAGRAAPGHRVVHDVVRDEEEGLQPLDAPAQSVGRKLVGRREAGGPAQHLLVRGQGVRDGHAPVQLAAGHVEVEHLREERRASGW